MMMPGHEMFCHLTRCKKSQIIAAQKQPVLLPPGFPLIKKKTWKLLYITIKHTNNISILYGHQ